MAMTDGDGEMHWTPLKAVVMAGVIIVLLAYLGYALGVIA